MIEQPQRIKGPDTDAASTGFGEDAPKPWEQIETGRYMPRRIRGSCRGRELG